jgi:hypothetical protein
MMAVIVAVLQLQFFAVASIARELAVNIEVGAPRGRGRF